MVTRKKVRFNKRIKRRDTQCRSAPTRQGLRRRALVQQHGETLTAKTSRMDTATSSECPYKDCIHSVSLDSPIGDEQAAIEEAAAVAAAENMDAE